ncbi:MAG: glycoside hydrolase family 16 protein [Clostridium sp.]|nr:glycoside hydrolase family 16 protein [Clostridium sp.]
MRKLLFAAFAAILLTGAAIADSGRPWHLAWSEDFDSARLDTAIWSRIPRGPYDWKNTQSDTAPDLVGFRDGKLVLRGIANPDRSRDTAGYLTGGIYTLGKRRLATPCRIEVRARFDAARGAWPAIWLLPYDTGRFPWPTGGEIDIMERLNNDTFVYQTVHSTWTHTLGHNDTPPNSATAPIDPDEFNTYGVDIEPDRVRFSVNGQTTMVYPRVDSLGPEQFPFMTGQYLLLDMQLGGSWVGPVDKSDLPVEMEIDWVRHYTR